jgi:hypothetical protein
MKRRYFFFLLCLITAAAFTLAHQANAQRTRGPKVTSLQATSDKAGQHPATADITGPAPITCLNAVSETQNGQPSPSCHITAPGFQGKLKIGEKANATGPGKVTLTCNGPGMMLRCSARIN